jgi:hypothetical protein
MTDPIDGCPCLTHGPRVLDIADERYIDRDDTDGRFADLSFQLCARCGRGWINYLVEREDLTAAGRWVAALIDPDTAMIISAGEAAEYIGNAPWRRTGGSAFGGVVRRIDGPGWPARRRVA